MDRDRVIITSDGRERIILAEEDKAAPITAVPLPTYDSPKVPRSGYQGDSNFKRNALTITEEQKTLFDQIKENLGDNIDKFWDYISRGNK